MFCSVNVSACFEISVPGPGIVVIDLLAASKNILNAFSACSMVFSARSRSSGGTSSFGSMVHYLPVQAAHYHIWGAPVLSDVPGTPGYVTDHLIDHPRDEPKRRGQSSAPWQA